MHFEKRVEPHDRANVIYELPIKKRKFYIAAENVSSGKECKIQETPEWSTRPDGPGILCNTCGYGRILVTEDYQEPAASEPEVTDATGAASVTRKKRSRREFQGNSQKWPLRRIKLTLEYTGTDDRPSMDQQQPLMIMYQETDNSNEQQEEQLAANPPSKIRWCRECKSQETPKWRGGPDGPHTLCNACGVRYRKLFLNSHSDADGIKSCRKSKHEMDQEHTGGSKLKMQSSSKVRCCSECESQETPQWRAGPDGPGTLCNRCGVRYRKPLFTEDRDHPASEPGVMDAVVTSENEESGELPSCSSKVDQQQTDSEKSCEIPSSKSRRCRECKIPSSTANDAVSKKELEDSSKQKYQETVGDKSKVASKVRRCKECKCRDTPQWRAGPDGPGTLCNACGVRYRKLNLTESASDHPTSSAIGQKCSSTSDSEIKCPVPAAEQEQLVTCVDRSKERSEKSKQNISEIRRCKECKSQDTPQWRSGPDGPGTLCNACGVRYRKLSVTIDCDYHASDPEVMDAGKKRSRRSLSQFMNSDDSEAETEASESESDTDSDEQPSQEKQSASTPRRCSECKRQETPQWRTGPDGPGTLCNACGVRYRKLSEEVFLDSSGTGRKRSKEKSMQRMQRSSTDQIKQDGKDTQFKEENSKHSKARRCKECKRQETPQWRAGPDGPGTLCNACGVRYRKQSLSEDSHRSHPTEPEVVDAKEESPKLKIKQQLQLQPHSQSQPQPQPQQQQQQQKKKQEKVRRCQECKSQETPQWRGGPDGPGTLCNACGVRYRRLYLNEV